VPKSTKFVETFEKWVGVKHYSSFKYLDKYLRRKYGKQKTDQLLEVIDQRARGLLVDIYPLLYEDLDLSIDLLSLNGDMHRNYLAWFSEQDFGSPLNILDVACGNGYLTCFYATKFPGSQVLGVDNSHQAIECATELARRLKLTNVKFEVVDVAGPELSSLPQGQDLITAITAFRSMLTFPDFDNSRPLRQLLQTYRQSVRIDALNNLSSLLLPRKGIFLSFERWQHLRGFGWWVCAIQNAGLFVDFTESGPFSFTSLASERVEQGPVLWCRSNDENAVQNLDDTISFWLLSKYRKDFDKYKTFDLHHDLAEAAFVSINPKILLRGAKAVSGESAVRRIEIWQAGPFLLFFQFDSEGNRSLEVLPSVLYDGVAARLDELAKALKSEGEVTFYDQTEVIWAD
jgi:SAM-dependent methyltransferase